MLLYYSTFAHLSIMSLRSLILDRCFSVSPECVLSV